MAKRKFAFFSLIILGGIFIGLRANAQNLYLDDGCAALGGIIHQTVLSELVFDDSYPADSNDPDFGGAQSCSNTTATVTSAFRGSLLQVNMVIRWSALPLGGDAACGSHDLSYCYPSQDPAGPALQASELAFIQNSWQIIRNGVMAQMPWGVASNISYFDAQTLRSSFGSSFNGPLSSDVGSIGGPY